MRFARDRETAKRFGVAVCAGVLAACASLPPPATPQAPVTTVEAPFSIGGRISARRGDAAVAGAFTWTHDGQHDSIELSTPLGQMLAKLDGDAHDVTVHLSDGRVESGPTWSALNEKVFGVTIPVDGLASWIRALPRPIAQYSVERDDSGRVSLLRQDGWEVVYAYADNAAPRPFRVTLRYPGAEPVEVRVVVDRWQ